MSLSSVARASSGVVIVTDKEPCGGAEVTGGEGDEIVVLGVKTIIEVVNVGGVVMDVANTQARRNGKSAESFIYVEYFLPLHWFLLWHSVAFLGLFLWFPLSGLLSLVRFGC